MNGCFAVRPYGRTAGRAWLYWLPRVGILVWPWWGARVGVGGSAYIPARRWGREQCALLEGAGGGQRRSWAGSASAVGSTQRALGARLGGWMMPDGRLGMRVPVCRSGVTDGVTAWWYLSGARAWWGRPDVVRSREPGTVELYYELRVALGRSRIPLLRVPLAVSSPSPPFAWALDFFPRLSQYIDVLDFPHRCIFPAPWLTIPRTTTTPEHPTTWPLLSQSPSTAPSPATSTWAQAPSPDSPVPSTPPP